MTRSENGWPAPPPAGSLKRVQVPGTSRGFTIRADIAPILLYVARRVHTEVAPIDTGAWDEWGYAAPIPIPGSSTISNHGSGTAIDINSALWPWKRLTMRVEQRAAMQSIMKACGGQVRWGGDYKSTKDEMHSELAPGTTVASVKAQIARMGLRADGTVKPAPEPAPKPAPKPSKKYVPFALRTFPRADYYGYEPAHPSIPRNRIADGSGHSPADGRRRSEIKLMQGWLRTRGFYKGGIDGRFGPLSDSAVRRFQSAARITSDGLVGPVTWKALQ